MSNQHCPGFESNKSLSEIKIKCPDCGKVLEIFSDEADKNIKCPGCGTMLAPQDCKAEQLQKGKARMGTDYHSRSPACP